MTAKKQVSKTDIQESLPSTELVQQELAKAKSMDDFFGKEGIFARLFSNTLEADAGSGIGRAVSAMNATKPRGAIQAIIGTGSYAEEDSAASQWRNVDSGAQGSEWRV